MEDSALPTILKDLAEERANKITQCVKHLTDGTTPTIFPDWPTLDAEERAQTLEDNLLGMNCAPLSPNTTHILYRHGAFIVSATVSRVAPFATVTARAWGRSHQVELPKDIAGELSRIAECVEYEA